MCADVCTSISYEEEDTCMSYEEEDTCMCADVCTHFQAVCNVSVRSESERATERQSERATERQSERESLL